MSILTFTRGHHDSASAHRGTGTSPRRTVLAIALIFGLTSIVTLAHPQQAFAWDNQAYSASSEAELVTLTNRSRASAGLKALKVDSTLRSVARWRSKDMIDRDYFSHTIPGYGKVWDKLHSIDYCYNVAGENIGWNNYPDDIATSSIHQMFMNSAGHRANILGKDWDVIGVGAYKGPDGKKMWTVLFADKCGSTAPPSTPKPTAKPKPKPTAKPTPRPTTKPTAKPKPKPTAAPQDTAEPVVTAEPTPDAATDPDDLATPQLPPDELPDPGDDPDASPDDGSGSSDDPNAIPSDDPDDSGPFDGAVAMRVVDPGTSGGLLETIVGGVTGFFFGG